MITTSSTDLNASKKNSRMQNKISSTIKSTLIAGVSVIALQASAVKLKYENNLDPDTMQTFESLNGKSIRVQPVADGEGEVAAGPAQNLSLAIGSEILRQDITAVKSYINQSTDFMSHTDYVHHEKTMTVALHEKYNENQPYDIAQNPQWNALMQTFFRVEQNELGLEKHRNTWTHTNEPRITWSITKNKKGVPSVIFQDKLGNATPFVVPIYKDKLHMDVDVLQEQGANLNALQKEQVNYLYYLIGNKNDLFRGNAFKQNLGWALHNPNDNFDTLKNRALGINVRELPELDSAMIQSTLERTVLYHLSRGVMQFTEVPMSDLITRAYTRIKYGWEKKPDTAPLINAWEDLTKKPGGYQGDKGRINHIENELVRTFFYHKGNKVQIYVDLAEIERNELLRIAKNLVVSRNLDPDTGPLQLAFEILHKR